MSIAVPLDHGDAPCARDRGATHPGPRRRRRRPWQLDCI